MDRMQAEQVAQSEVDAGERLLWSGTPNATGMALGALPAALFGIPFGGFAAFWIWTAYSATSKMPHPSGPFAFFPLFGIPFLLVGLGMLTAPLWTWLSATKTVYAVTDKRVLIITGGGMKSIQSFGPADLGDLARVAGADGSGSLTFGAGTWPGATTGTGAFVRAGSIGRPMRVTLVGIPDVRDVEHLIRENLLAKAA